jgi:ariadne-1
LVTDSAPAPPTPATQASIHTMSSEDEYLSNATSDDDMPEDSEDFDFDDGNDFDDYDDDGDVYEDGDLDYGMTKIEKPKRAAYEVAYKVYEPSDVQRQQDDMIDDVNVILQLRTEDVAILLRHFRWNKERVLERYMDDPERTLGEAGLVGSGGPPRLQTVPGFVCEICYEDGDNLESFALKCGHRYCVDCYRHYLAQKIMEEGEAARIQCPSEGCGRIIDARSLDLLVTPDLVCRYHRLLNRTYVEDRDSLKWCPAPDCPNAVECVVKRKDLDKVVPTVACACGQLFCFGCNQAVDHQPAPCELVNRWLKKCADDSETANWISANTKECPMCNSTIEKNGGCNHMTCRKCKYEFCWMCMGLWSEHGTSWYNCNRFEEKSGTQARDAQAKSRVSLERYLHYYNRYANHDQSARLDRDLYHKTERKMMQLQSTSGMSWIEVQYLQTASEALQTCRQTLKWTYAFAFYLARNNQTTIFEDNQRDLEMAVEALSGMFEKPVTELGDAKLKVDMMDKTAYCNRRRVILLEDTAINLANRKWLFNHDAKGTRLPVAVPPPETT